MQIKVLKQNIKITFFQYYCDDGKKTKSNLQEINFSVAIIMTDEYYHHLTLKYILVFTCKSKTKHFQKSFGEEKTKMERENKI